MNTEQLLVDSLACAAAVLDAQAAVVAHNAAWVQVMGEAREPDETIARDVWRATLAAVLGGEAVKGAPLIHQHQRRWLLTRITRFAARGQGALVTHEDLTGLRSGSQVRELLDATTALTGLSLLGTVAKMFAELSQGDLGLVGELQPGPPLAVQTLAVHHDGAPAANFRYALAHSPCEQVVGRGVSFIASGVAQRFPLDTELKRLSAEGYLGMPLFAPDGSAVGILVAISRGPMTAALDTQLLSVLATRAGAELARLRTESSLRESQERLQLAIVSTDDGVFDYDLRTGRIHGNARLTGMLGYPAHALPTIDDWLRIVHPEDLARTQAAMRAHLEGTAPLYRAEVRLRCADGTWKWILDRGKVVERGPGGSPWRLTGLHSDITPLKRLEAQVQINERMASVGTLAASLAHEMNTPLQYLKAGLDALGGKTPNEGALRMALEGAERIREVVRDVKAFSHVDPDARRTRVDVVDVLHRAVRLARLEVEQRATLEVEVGQLPPVEANDAQLAHVFLNLLINAGQAIAPGSRGHVRVSGRTTPAGAALIEVHDDGSGIAPDAAPFVFEPFFTTKPAGQGTGLGLAVCHGVVLALGGTLTFESAPGRTVFRVELPASTSLTPPAGVPSVRTGPARRSVLVVDDHPAMCTSLQLMLHEVHEVEAVTSALEALTLMEARLFDVVLCDLMMPGLSGMELYEQVRAKNPEQASRFVFMTGGAATRSAARFLEQTHARVLEKPFAPEQLYAALR